MALTGRESAMADRIADAMIANGTIQEEGRQGFLDIWVDVCKGIIDEIVASAEITLSGATVASGIAVSTPDTLTGNTTETGEVTGGGSLS